MPIAAAAATGSGESDDVRLAHMEERLKTVASAVDRNHVSQTDGQKELVGKLDALGSKMEATYATKTALDLVDKKVTSMQAYVGWTLKAIVTAIVTGVAGFLFAHGGSHP